MKTVHYTFSDFLQAEGPWNAAVQTSLDNNIFLSWEWLSTWWKHFGAKRAFLLTAVTIDKRILAAMPLMKSTYSVFGMHLTKIHFIGFPESDYHSFVLTKSEPEYVDMMLKHTNDLASHWDVIELNRIPETSETMKTIRTISRPPFAFAENVEEGCPFVSLPRRFEDYFSALSPHFRKNLKWRERRIRRDYRVDFQLCETIETASEGMKNLFHLSEKRWAQKGALGPFSDPRMRDFHSELAMSFVPRGWLVLGILNLDDEPVAAAYSFRYANKLYCYQSAFDPEFSKYGVGSLCEMYLIDRCIRNRLEEYDFLRGEEPYKNHWNTLTRRNLRFIVTKKNISSTVYAMMTKNHKLANKLRHFERLAYA